MVSMLVSNEIIMKNKYCLPYGIPTDEYADGPIGMKI